MIISRIIETRWNPTTRKHYESKGYTYTKHNESFTVKVEDLPRSSNVKVEVACDYCMGKNYKQYKVYCESIEKSLLNKHSCKSCEPIKRTEELEEKNKRGLLVRGEIGYWMFQKNRDKELKAFIDKHGSIHIIREKDRDLYDAISGYDNRTLEEVTSSLGYKWDEISNKSPVNYYNDFKNVREKIETFVELYNRFPTVYEFNKDLKIQCRSLAVHGGINSIKDKLGYNDENDFVDDRGFRNRSSIEYFVAQYLIANKITYEREQSLFPNRQFRGDFLIESVNGESFNIEVWGIDRNDMGRVAQKYNKDRKEKEALYKLFGMNLISIEYDEMRRMTYENMQKYLISKFSFLDGQNLKVFNNVNFLHPKKLSDKEILSTIMEYSDNENCLPNQERIIDLGLHSYIVEIRKRYETYLNFAIAFNKELETQKHCWNKETIYEAMTVIVSRKQPINKDTVRESGFSGMVNKFKGMFNTRGFTTPKIEFYHEYIKANDYIHEEDMRFLINIANNKRTTSTKITEENQRLAEEILATIASKAS